MNVYKRITHTIALPGLTAAMLIIAGCSGADGAGDAEAAAANAPGTRTVRVETLVLQPSEFEDRIELTGTVEADNDAILSAQTAGTVVNLAERGHRVQAGQVVAQLDPAIARAAVEQAEASVAAAQAQFDLAADNLKRQEPLYRDSVISALEFENVRAGHNQAQAQLSQAKAALAQAQQQLRNTSVTAPFSGVVEERLVEKGEQVMPGTPVVRIVNTNLVKITAGVPERYAGDIEIGTPVQVDLASAGIGKRNGRVSFVGSAIDPQSRTFPIEISLENVDARLKPQMVARLYVTRQRVEDAIVVPRTAVLADENGTSVFVATRAGDVVTAERREVVLGAAYGGQAVVQTGLTAGDEVIILGQSNVTQGDALEVVERHDSAGALADPLATR